MANRSEPDKNSFIQADLFFEDYNEARTYVLGMGNSVKVLEPESLRLSVMDYSRQIAEMYDKSR
jgi:predicted DNA-binding transcriptional regulator YafY